MYSYLQDMNDYCEFYYYCRICDNTGIKRTFDPDFLDSDIFIVLMKERNIDGLNIVLPDYEEDENDEEDEEDEEDENDFYSFTPLMYACLFQPDDYELIEHLLKCWALIQMSIVSQKIHLIQG